jgi:hypothetical protein
VTAPDAVRSDAQERSWRTFLNGLGWDAAIVLLPLVYDAFSKWDGSFTAGYWIAVGVGLLKTLGMAAAAYALRYAKKPKNSV